MSSRNRQVLAAIATMVALAGCSGTPERIAGEARSAWVGKTFDAFVLKHGVPQTTQKLADGRTVAEWTDTFGVAATGAPIEALLMAGSNAQVQGGSYQLACKVRFIVSKAGVIEEFTIVTDTYGKWVTSRCAEIFQ